jgi:flagellar protein FlaI
VEGAGIKPGNILVAGGSGSGKTTTLNCLCSFIPDTERIITIEDTAELQLPATHWVRLETKPPNVEGKGEVDMDELVKNTLRMRPDRVIVGEVRGPEARTLFTAMNTGHDGSMGTLDGK